MDWWGWIVAGAILLGAELALVDAQFYLVFLGLAGILTGLAAVAAPALPGWAQWAMFAALSLVSMVTFRRRVYDNLRGRTPSVATGPAGGVLTLPVSLAPGETCQAEHGGAFWTVRNDGPAALAAGAHVRVAAVHGLTLLVRGET